MDFIESEVVEVKPEVVRDIRNGTSTDPAIRTAITLRLHLCCNIESLHRKERKCL